MDHRKDLWVVGCNTGCSKDGTKFLNFGGNAGLYCKGFAKGSLRASFGGCHIVEVNTPNTCACYVIKGNGAHDFVDLNNVSCGAFVGAANDDDGFTRSESECA